MQRVHTLLLLISFTTNRSIGYNREAEMIEQQLKMKQATNQQVAMAAGKYTYHKRV